MLRQYEGQPAFHGYWVRARDMVPWPEQRIWHSAVAFTPRLAQRSMAALLANKGLTREVRFKGARFRGADRTGKCRPVHRIRGRLRSNFRVGDHAGVSSSVTSQYGVSGGCVVFTVG